MTRPQRYLIRMGLFLLGVCLVAALLAPALVRYFLGKIGRAHV